VLGHAILISVTDRFLERFLALLGMTRYASTSAEPKPHSFAMRL
jgi:hypothetical protein